MEGVRPHPAPAFGHHYLRLLTIGSIPISDLDFDEDQGKTTTALDAHRPAVGEATDELAEQQLNLALRLQRLEDVLGELASDPWAGPGAQAMHARVLELVHVSTAIENVCRDARDWRIAAMLQDDAPLAEYVRGVLAWADGVVRAFDVLAAELAAFAPGWARARERIDDACDFHLGGLVDTIRRDACAIGIDPVSPQGRRLEELFWASSWLETTLTARLAA